MKRQLRKQLSQLLPAYLVGTLGLFGRLIVALWLRFDATARAELAQLGQLQEVIRLTADKDVPSRLLDGVMRQVHEQEVPVAPNAERTKRRPLARRLAWLTLVLFALLAVALVWFVMPPVISLEWSVSGGYPTDHYYPLPGFPGRSERTGRPSRLRIL